LFKLIKISCIFLFYLLIFISSSKLVFAISGSEISNNLKKWFEKQNILAEPNFAKNRKFKDCNNKIEFEKVFDNFSLIKATCKELNGWSIFLKSNYVNKKESKKRELSKKHFISIRLKYSHEKGDIITNEALEIKFENKKSDNFYTDVNQIIGRKLKQNLKKGMIVKPRHLLQKFDTNQGDQIIIMSKIGSTVVSSMGISLNSGNIGDMIEVKNIRSGKLIKGIIKKNKIIQVYR